MAGLKSLLKHTAVYGLSSIVGRVLNYLLVPLYTRIFAAEVYGIVTELYAYTGFFMIVLTFGLETGYFRFVNKLEDGKKLFHTLNQFVSVLSVSFLLLVLLTKNSISDVLGYTEQSHFIVLLAFIIFFDALTALPFAKLRNENRAAEFALVRLVNIAINIGLNVFLILLVPRYFYSVSWLVTNGEPRVEAIFVSNLAASLFVMLYFTKDFLRVFKKADYALLSYVLKYSWPLLIMGLAGMVNETFDRAIMRHLITVPEGILDKSNYIMAQIGIYGANYKLSILMTLFIQAYRYAAEPYFFAIAKNADSRLMYAKVMEYFVAFGLLIFLFISFYLPYIKYFIDDSYHSGLMVVPVLLLANLFLGIVYNLSIWYKVTERTSYGMWIGVSGAVSTLLLNYWLVPIYGYVGAAYATMICYFTMMLFSYFLSLKYYPIPYRLGLYLVFLLVSAALYWFDQFVLVQVYYKAFISGLLLVLAGAFFYYLIRKDVFNRK